MSTFMNEKKKKRISIRRKLLLSYFALVALIILVGVVGGYNIRSVYKNSNEIYVYNLNSVDYLKSISQNIKEIDQYIVSMMSELGKDQYEKYKLSIEKLQADNEELMRKYEKLQLSAMEKRRYKQCRLSILTFNKQIDNILERLDKQEKEAAILQYQQELTPAKACTYELVEAVVEMAVARAKQKNADNKIIFNNIIWLISATILVAVIAAIVIAVRMSNYFTGKLLSIQHLAQRFSEYNVSGDITDTENDEFGETMEALNDSQFKMRELLEKIIEESTDISDAGMEVSQAVRKSNQRIEEINVKVYDAGNAAENSYNIMFSMLEDRALSPELVNVIRNVMEQNLTTKSELKQVQTELSNIAMYLEQIAITSEHQNEIATGHKQQVEKFKV